MTGMLTVVMTPVTNADEEIENAWAPKLVSKNWMLNEVAAFPVNSEYSEDEVMVSVVLDTETAHPPAAIAAVVPTEAQVQSEEATTVCAGDCCVENLQDLTPLLL